MLTSFVSVLNRSFFAGDALAAPTHWYYGGQRQVLQDYGRPITDYTKPNYELRGSILNKSDLNGGGRSKWNSGGRGGRNSDKAIIGDVINHGKQDLWSPQKQIHYHATLQKGENTLEVSLARVLMKTIVENSKKRNKEDNETTTNKSLFDAGAFRNAYMKFMMTPNSHNDTYASTCHRMFFSNLVHKELPPTECPDNDMHNVDTIDGLILPTIAAMTEIQNPSKAGEVAAQCAAVTRKSSVLEQISNLWGSVVVSNILNTHDSSLESFSQATLRRKPNPRSNDALTACYLQQSLPGLVDMISKYSPNGSKHNNRVWEALLANANVGGENVHRGSVLGAMLGSQVGIEQIQSESPQLVEGLYHSNELKQEIDDFVKAVLPRPPET